MAAQKIAHEEVPFLEEHTSPHAIGRERAGRKVWQSQRAKHIAINVFLAFHISAVACWCVPIDSPLIPSTQGGQHLHRSHSCLQGRLKKDLDIPEDGATEPNGRVLRNATASSLSNLQRDETDDLLPDAARYIARLNSSPGNPVKTVILIQKFSFIVPRLDGAYVPEPWEQHILLGYGVQPQDLK